MRLQSALLALTWVLAGATGASADLSKIPEGAFGKTIGAIQFDSPGRMDVEALVDVLAVRTGESFGEEALLESLERLREKEIFSSVSVEVIERGPNVAVRFVLTPADFVVGIEIVGEGPIDESEILRRVRFREDEPISEAKTTTAAERVRALYAERGYPDAWVGIEPNEVSPGRVEVRIRIVPGDAVELARLELFGVPAEIRSEAPTAVGFSRGDVFPQDRPSAARDALLRFLRRRGFYEAEVREAHEIENKRAVLRLDARTGPKFEVVIRGNESIGRDRLLGLTDLARRPIITDGTWRLLARRMEELYREEGYAYAEVDVEIAEADTKRIRYDVREGPRVRVEAVRFEGLSGLERGDLLAVMETRPHSSMPFRGEAWFRHDVLEADLDRIRARYRSEGYLEAEIGEVRRELTDDRARMTLVIPVLEGPQSRVELIDLEGADRLLHRPTRGLALRPGEAFDPDALERDLRELERRLAAVGHSEARATAERRSLEPVGGVVPVTVVYRVDPGPRIHVGRVVVQQNYFTRDSVIRRELPFQPGDPLDPALLLEGQRRLYKLGAFRSVSIRAVGDGPDERDVYVRVVERPAGQIEYGFGYNTRAGLRTFLQVGHRNVRGTGRPVSLRGELNLSPDDLVPDEWILALQEKEPRLFASRFDLTNNLVFQRSERSIDEFSIRRFSFDTGIEREIIEGFRVSASIQFEDSRVFDVAPDAVLTGQDVGRLRIVSLNPVAVYDGRDDAFAPTRGVFDSVRLRYGSPAVGSEIHFVKVSAAHSQYVPLGRGVTFLYAGRGGVAESLDSSEAVPLRERFFLGGRTTVRGFDENEIGPRGEDGNPTGGDLFFAANTEIRFPLLWGLRGAAFFDGGGLYLRNRGVSIREVRKSAGPGLRYQTPVGAISLDYGFKLDRRDGESIGEVHFTIGNLF